MALVGKTAFRRGRSRSTRPVSKRPPNWVVYQPDEVKALIINMAREAFARFWRRPASRRGYPRTFTT